MASRPYKTSLYLKDSQDRAAYLNEILENGDFNAFLIALNNLADSTKETNIDLNIENIKQANLLKLNNFLHSLGLKLSIDVF